jgi:dTMP kinase
MIHQHPFIAIEGINGAGKSTIRDVFERHHTDRGEDVFLLGQYGWLVPSAAATIIAFRERRGEYTNYELIAAHLADRAMTYRDIIAPHLRHGPLVGDRSLISDGPYLEALEGIPAEQIVETYAEANLVFPDVTVFVPAEPRQALERIDNRGGGRKVYETYEILRKVNAAYERLTEGSLLRSLTTVVRADSVSHADLPALANQCAMAGASR